MSVSTLSRFTVPLSNQQTPVNQALLMPKLQYRFRVTLISFGVTKPSTELTKHVMDVTRPSVTFDEMVLDVYNSRINLLGKPTWDPITINIRDDVNGNVQRLVGEQLQKQFDFYEQASAASGIDYKFQTFIEILDGGNGVWPVGILETFELYGCQVTTANYNTLDYKTSEPATITLTIRFDNAIQTNGPGVGAPIGRTTGVMSTGAGIDSLPIPPVVE